MNLSLKMLTGILISIFAVSASAQFNRAVWDTLTADNVQDILTSQSIAVNGYEQFHLTYGKARPSGGWNVYYRFYDILAGLGPEIAAETSMACYNPVAASIFGDEYSEVVIVFESGGEIWGCINTIPAGPWDFINISNSADDDMSPTIAYGYNSPQGAWITYTEGEYKIKYARGEDDSIYTETIEDSQLGEFGSGAKPYIVVMNNLPHIFYRGVNDGAYNIHHAYKIDQDSSWIIEYLETPNADDYMATATSNNLGDIFLAVCGNDYWGLPYHVYYLKFDAGTGAWLTPQLATGQYSASNPSIIYRPGNIIYIASCGVTENVYNGNVYISSNTTGSFQTQLLASYNSVTQPVLSDVIGEYGVLMFDAPIHGERSDNIEIVYYGPNLQTGMGQGSLPIATSLMNCYPNPFNSQAKIAFSVGSPGQVILDIFDINGRKVQTLINGRYDTGKYEATWRAKDYASGVYFYRLSIDGVTQTKKMVLLK